MNEIDISGRREGLNIRLANDDYDKFIEIKRRYEKRFDTVINEEDMVRTMMIFCDKMLKCLENEMGNVTIISNREDVTILKYIDYLEQLIFFNQRAGRELWADKPREIQDKDIKNANDKLNEILGYFYGYLEGYGYVYEEDNNGKDKDI